MFEGFQRNFLEHPLRFRIVLFLVFGWNFSSVLPAKNNTIWMEFWIWVFPKIGVPQNGWFTIENPIKMDDLGVPLFSETSISNHILCPLGCPETTKIQAHRFSGFWAWKRLNFAPLEVRFFVVKFGRNFSWRATTTSYHPRENWSISGNRVAVFEPERQY